MIIDLIRHGDSEWMEYAKQEPEAVFGGRMDEVPLSQRGVEQSRMLGVYLKRNGIRPTACYSSPAQRAIQTHAYSVGGQCHVVNEFHEMFRGSWEREPRAKMLGNPEVEQEIRRVGMFNFRPPNGESYADVRSRTLPVVGRLIRKHQLGDHILIYAHKNVILALVAKWHGWDSGRHYLLENAEVPPVSITRLNWQGKRLELGFFARRTL